MRRASTLAAVALAAALGLYACTEPAPSTAGRTTAPAPAPTTTTPAPADQVVPDDVDQQPEADTVVELLDLLPVKGRAPQTGYDREQFGSAWTDDVTVPGGHNGCDTRNDILRRDLTALAVEPGTSGCVAATGTLPDPYTGDHLPFVRGEDSASQIHIDHLVSLSNAWQTGAQQLSVEERQNFANDPLNLWAVSGWTNQQKSDGDAATWLPPNDAIRCDLVARQAAVKARYGLWLTQPEADAMRRVLQSCPDHPVPTSAD